METMHLVPPTTTPEGTLADEALVALFEAAGLDVTIVNHCDDAGCPICFQVMPAQAA